MSIDENHIEDFRKMLSKNPWIIQKGFNVSKEDGVIGLESDGRRELERWIKNIISKVHNNAHNNAIDMAIEEVYQHPLQHNLLEAIKKLKV